MSERSIKLGDSIINAPKPSDVRASVLMLENAGDPELPLFAGVVGSDDGLIVHFVPGLGFYVSGSEPGGNEYYTAIGAGSVDSVVEVFVAGDSGRYQKRVFLDRDLTGDILECFIEQGRLFSGCAWLPAGDVMM